MGRMKCLWVVLSLLAVGFTIPVPEEITQQDLMAMILNAKPEDNDINDISQPLINNADTNNQVPVPEDGLAIPQEPMLEDPTDEAKEVKADQQVIAQDATDQESEVDQSDLDKPKEPTLDGPANDAPAVIPDQKVMKLEDVDSEAVVGQGEPIPDAGQSQTNQEDPAIVIQEGEMNGDSELPSPVSNEKFMPVEEQGESIPFEEQVETMPFEVQAEKFEFDEVVEDASFEEQGESMPFEEQGGPMPFEESIVPMVYVDQEEVDQDDGFIIIDEEQLQDELEELSPFINLEPMGINPEEELYEIALEPSLSQEDMGEDDTIFMPEGVPVYIERADTSSFIGEEPEEINPFDEDLEEINPFDEEPEEINPFNEYPEEINPYNEQFVEEQPIMVPESYEEQSIPVYDNRYVTRDSESYEEQSIPVYDNRFATRDSESYEEQSIPVYDNRYVTRDSEDMIMAFEDREPTMEDPEYTQGNIMVPINDGKPDMPFPVEEESVFGGPFTSPNFEEEQPEEDSLPVYDEFGHPVYFEMSDDLNPSMEVRLEVPDYNRDMIANMPSRPPFSMINIDSDFVNTEVFPVDSSEYSNEDESGPEEKPLEEYYIPDDDVFMNDQNDNSESQIIALASDFLDIESSSESDSFDGPSLFGEEDIMTEDEESSTEMDLNERLMNPEMIRPNSMIFEGHDDLIPVIEENINPLRINMEESMYMIEPQGFKKNLQGAMIDIIQIGSLPENQEESFRIEPTSSDIFESDMDEDIVPIIEISPENRPPFVIEGNNYLPPKDMVQQPIIFPIDMPRRHNLPVFPEDWSEDNFYHHPSDSHVDSSYSSPSRQDLSYGPDYTNFKSYGYENRPSYNPLAMSGMPNIEIYPQGQGMLPLSDQNTFGGDDDFDNDDDDFDMNQYDNFPPFSREDYPNSRFPNVRERFENLESYEYPAAPEMSFQQDSQGPNTFPLNVSPQDQTSEKSLANVASKQSFQQSTNPDRPFNAMIFQILSNKPKPQMNQHKKNFYKTPNVFGTSSLYPSILNQRQDQYVAQPSYIPQRNRNNRPNRFSERYSNAYVPFYFNDYQDFSYDVPSYGEPSIFPQSGSYHSYYPSQDRYGMNYNYRNQHDHYHAYDYPTPTW